MNSRGKCRWLGMLAAFLVCAALPVHAAEARVIKVLTHLVDQQDRNALAPSLYERDAYQLHLRSNPDLIAGMRFDVQFKAPSGSEPVLLRIEARGSKSGLGMAQVFETEVKPARWFSTWGRIALDRTATDALGTVVAWRATIWRDGQMLAEQQSFLW
ncbi:MAG: hypothetical protein ACXW3Z_08280 [Limisphaerales bacterium]